jgi:putative ABC transport system ATP-binding protein
MLQARGISKTYESAAGPVPVLEDVNLDLNLGDALSIMGPSGSGKSTLLGLLAGLDNPTAGSILLDGEEIVGLSEDSLARLRGRKLGFVFQSYQLIPTLTAEENVLLPAELCGAPGQPAQRARELLDSVGLAERRDHYPIQLSGGEQQRVALARAFMLAPPILMADEPTGNLDSANGQHVLDLLLTMNRQQRTTLVLVTHDPQLAARADRRLLMRDGVIVSDE